jgi:SAM-dependent methyltransferase
MEWWEDIYNRDIYFRLYETGDTKLAAKEVEGIISLLKLQPQTKILDLCCGYGRHSTELAKKGFKVVGVDISEKQIQHAIKRAKESNVDVVFQIKDARKLDFNEEFDFVINMFVSFGYFKTEKEDKDMLRGVFKALKPGGKFLMDFWNTEKELKDLKPRIIEKIGDIIILKDWEFDAVNKRLNWKNTITFPDGRKESWSHSIRAYTVAEIKKLIEESGLKSEKVYGSLKGEKYTINSPAAIITAIKK